MVAANREGHNEIMSPDPAASDVHDGATVSTGLDSRRARLREFVEGKRFQKVIIGLIAFNSVVLGLETSPTVMARMTSPMPTGGT